MEIKARNFVFTYANARSMKSTTVKEKILKLSDLVGIKITEDTILEIHTKDTLGNINFDEVDITELYALKKKIKDAINRKQAIIALMQQLQALRDMGVEEVDISGYHITRIKECSTSTT